MNNVPYQPGGQTPLVSSPGSTTRSWVILEKLLQALSVSVFFIILKVITLLVIIVRVKLIYFRGLEKYYVLHKCQVCELLASYPVM